MRGAVGAAGRATISLEKIAISMHFNYFTSLCYRLSLFALWNTLHSRIYQLVVLHPFKAAWQGIIRDFAVYSGKDVTEHRKLSSTC